MKTKLKKELHTKTIEELKIAITEAEKVLFDLNMEKIQNALKNVRSIFMKRKEIAVLKTILTLKEDSK